MPASAPRRSQRDRKQVHPSAHLPLPVSHSAASQSPNKRKRAPQPVEDDPPSELSDRDDPTDDEQDFTSKPKKRTAPPRKPKGPPPAKKPRTTRPTVPKPRRAKAKPANGHFDATKVATDTKINADNPLFSTCVPRQPPP